jgi:hypothetical protein
MALSDLFGLLGGGNSDPLDIYGDLFTKEQKAALQQRSANEGLLRMAGAFGAAAQPSRMPTSFMGVLGQAAGAMAGHGDETANTALKGMEVAEKVRQSRQERAILAKAAPLVEAITRKLIGAGVPAAQASEIATQVAGSTAAPPGQTPAPTGAPQPASAPYLGPTNEELGAPPTQLGNNLPPPPAAPAAPGGARPGGLPARIGMSGTGPNAVMIDLDTGQPIQSSPGGPITMPPGAPPPAGQQNTGLLPKPLDQVVGADGQPLQGPGILPTMNASYGGAPGGMPPFRLATPSPTESATPGADGLDVVLPSGPRLQRSDLTNVAAPAGAFDQAVNYLQKELGLQPHQARGAVKWMQNVESGLDPNIVNSTSGAYGIGQHLGSRKTSLMQKYGPNPSFEQQLSHIKDELQGPEKAALNSLRNTSTENEAFRTWGRDFERPSPAEYAKATGQDYVIPSGRGIPRSALTDVADTGAATGSGVIPGLGITPEALAGLNAMLKMGGLKSDPFGSLLETYYKSPGYLGEKTRTEEVARKKAGLEYDPLIAAQTEIAKSKVELEYKPKIEEAVQRLQSPILKERAQAQADIDRYSEELKQNRQAALTPTTATVTFPGENMPREIPITAAQLPALATGRGIPELGIPPGARLGKPVPSEEDKAGIQARGAAQTEMYKAGQKALDTAHDAVRGANQRAPYYGSMLTAMEGFKPGATADMKLTGMQYLRDLGVIKGDSVPQGEALRLAGERLAFLAVPPNQGSWSNVERQLLKSSIGGMSMTPEGLTDAIRMMQQLDDYDRKVSEIHRQVADKNQGLPNLLEAQRRVEALGPPLTAQQEAALERLRQPAAAAPAPPPAGGAPAPSGAIQTPYGTVRPISPTAPGTIIPIPPRP